MEKKVEKGDKVWITKYALTQGIFEAVVESNCLKSVPAGTMVQTEGRWSNIYHGNDWHVTHEAAVKQAEKMRTKKIASLEKQIKKLRAMSFG